MSNWFHQTTLAARQLLLPVSLRFSRLLTVRMARVVLSKLTPAVGSEPGRPRQLLADVSVISQSDAGTGIQRVVRELLRELISNPPPGYEVRPVYATRLGGFRYADQYCSKLMGKSIGSSLPVRVQAGDVFLGMDLAAHTLPRHHVELARWKASGVKFFFLVYDLLPVLHPQWFVMGLVKSYRNWIRTIAIFADSTLCISRSVSEELKQWLADTYGKSISQSISVTWFHPSSDISVATSKSNNETAINALLTRLAKPPTILMVGTVEPRKGYAQTLSAFEKLWQDGKDVNLVIVGRAGWKVDGLTTNIRNHAENGKRLLWLEDATDEILSALYEAVDGLLIASQGEGFGLPIIEAAQYGKPILARDIPVFREIAGEHAQYFSSTTPTALASDIAAWLDLIKEKRAVSSAGIGRLTWKESANQMLDSLGIS